ncbi:uncharacterized protein LOC105663580 isoform X2 [Megachile rotundata]|uniref:uncharacterized protein LOC105663580 isoform X2 n=1 Tax=Megachile rotundata TaxID=143995 RepID=UPI000614C15C|nr:PREDICTED: uncharacterized protein LOC105663580 [Megachile rotundata]
MHVNGHSTHGAKQEMVSDCKEKWKNIRNGFVRSLKLAASGSSTRQKKPYYLHDVMQFVLPFVKPASHTRISGNQLSPPTVETIIEETKHDEDTDEDATKVFLSAQKDDPLAGRQNKRVKPCDVDQMCANCSQQNPLADDYRKSFLISLLPDVHRLTDDEMREFKMKVLMVLDEILVRQQHGHATQAANRNFSPPPCIISHVSQHVSSSPPSIDSSTTPQFHSNSLPITSSSMHYDTLAQQSIAHCMSDQMKK